MLMMKMQIDKDQILKIKGGLIFEQHVFEVSINTYTKFG